MTPSPNDLTRQQLDELDALLQKMLAVPIASDPVAAPKAYVPEPPSAGNWRLDPPTPAVARQPHLAPASVPAYAEPAFAGFARPEHESVILETRVDPRSYLRQEPFPSPRLFGPAEPMASAPEPSYLPPPVQQRSVIVTPEPMIRSMPEPERFQDDPAITVEPPGVSFQPAMNLPFNPNDDTTTVPLSMATETSPADSRHVPLAMWPVYGVNRLVEFVLCLFGPPGELFTSPAMKWVLGLAGIGLLGTAAAWTARGMGWVSF